MANQDNVIDLRALKTPAQREREARLRALRQGSQPSVRQAPPVRRPAPVQREAVPAPQPMARPQQQLRLEHEQARELTPARKAPRRAKRSSAKRGWTAKRVGFMVLKAALLAGAAALCLSLNISLPERLIGIYFAASIIYKIDSQRTFLVALIFLVMVAVTSALGRSVPAENYAIYAFYFLVIGLVSAIRELVGRKHDEASGATTL